VAKIQIKVLSSSTVISVNSLTLNAAITWRTKLASDRSCAAVKRYWPTMHWASTELQGTDK